MKRLLAVLIVVLLTVFVSCGQEKTITRKNRNQKTDSQITSSNGFDSENTSRNNFEIISKNTSSGSSAVSTTSSQSSSIVSQTVSNQTGTQSQSGNDSTLSQSVVNSNNASSNVDTTEILPEITLIATDSTVDIVNSSLRSYLEDAANYKSGDATVVTNYPDANSAGGVTLKWQYSDLQSVKNQTVMISKNSDMSNADLYTVITTADSFEARNLQTGTKYYWQVMCENKSGQTVKSDILSFDTFSGPRILNLAGVKNARDVGGWQTLDGKTVKQGIAFRTATPDNATSTGLSDMVNVLEIKTQIDLRDLSSAKQSDFSKEVNYINVPVDCYYTEMLAGDYLEEIFSHLAKIENYPVLFHCAAGTDRTGVTAYVLKAFLGVDENMLIADYELSGLIEGYSNRTKEYSSFCNFASRLKSNSGETLSEKAYNYLKDKGMTEMELSNIYNIYLTDSALFKSDSLDVPESSSKVTFEIEMRNSGGVKGVTLNGNNADYTYNDGQLVINTSSVKQAKGSITFNDGATLNYEIK